MIYTVTLEKGFPQFGVRFPGKLQGGKRLLEEHRYDLRLIGLETNEIEYIVCKNRLNHIFFFKGPSTYMY